MWGDMELKHTSEGRKYLEYNERSSKTRNGSKAGDYRQVTPKMFAKPGDENCAVLMYKEYSSHRPTDLLQPESRFYLKPLAAPKGPVWYSHQPMGKDKLGKMMNTLVEKRQLDGRKVNHSTRKPFATTLVQAGLPPTEIAHLGGWKNIQSINEYSAPSVGQQAIASDLISGVMLPSNTDHSSEVVVQEISKQDSHNRVNFALVSNETLYSNRQSSNPYALLCGEYISGGTFNIKNNSGERKHISQSQSSQETD